MLTFDQRVNAVTAAWVSRLMSGAWHHQLNTFTKKTMLMREVVYSTLPVVACQLALI